MRLTYKSSMGDYGISDEGEKAIEELRENEEYGITIPVKFWDMVINKLGKYEDQNDNLNKMLREMRDKK